MKRLLDIYGNEEIIYHVKDEELRKSGLLTKNQLKELIESRRKTDIDKAYEEMRQTGVNITCITEDDYPSRLRIINTQPYMLFYYGELPREQVSSVAIIGARMCSDYGRKCAEYFASELAMRGVQIISGLASGIDGISQRAALEANGRSYGILGSGVDICYPASNRSLYERLKGCGGVISEYPLGTRPIAQNFPMRNRIISGLSDIVLVIEAKPRSGTSITVSMALDQGRSVYAVPGRIGDALSQGCNRMIYEGAGIANDAQAILDELERMNSVRCVNENETFSQKQTDLLQPINSALENDLERAIYGAIRNGAQSVEAIAGVIGENNTIQDIKSSLMYMTLRGVIKENVGVYEA